MMAPGFNRNSCARMRIPEGYKVTYGEYPDEPGVRMYVCPPIRLVYINLAADAGANMVRLVFR